MKLIDTQVSCLSLLSQAGRRCTKISGEKHEKYSECIAIVDY